jgi:hypothetical protein
MLRDGAGAWPVRRISLQDYLYEIVKNAVFETTPSDDHAESINNIHPNSTTTSHITYDAGTHNPVLSIICHK